MKTDEGYELIKGLIETRAASDPKVRSLLNRIASGDADFKTTSEYSRIVSEILGASLSEHILDLDDAAREEVCRMLLHDRYEDINDVLAEVQTSLDAKTGINIRPKKPPFQAERVASFAHSLADHTVVDQVIKRRAKNGSANISMSDHDRYMKTNAKLRNKAGLKCYIERETDGKCCEWCTKMAGRYAYPDDTPKDVFRRHDNCGCTVTYKNGRQRQDVWSKKTWEADKDERISKASGKEPTAFSKTEAQAKESEILAQRRLTYDRKRGIIYSLSNSSEKSYDPYSYEPKISKDVRVVFDSEFKRAEKKFGAISTVKGVYVLNDKSSDEGTYNEYSGFISLRHAEKKKGLQEMARIAREKYKEGKWSSGEPYHVIRHEIGHAIQSEHIRNDDRWDEKKKAILEVMYKAVNEEDGYKLPSKYSAQMPEEFISECIAASYKKSPGKTVNTVIRILNGGALNAGNA